MKISILSLTSRGAELGERLSTVLREQGEEVDYCDRKKQQNFSLSEWTARAFSKSRGIIFVSAVGIAARAIAPYLKSKISDPAVVAVDEQGRFSVALISGHIGGANRLASRVAELTGAVPVITTATDLSGNFAIDSWAVDRGLRIANPERIKLVSGKALEGAVVTLASEFPVRVRVPEGLLLVQKDGDAVCSFWDRRSSALCLVPPVAVLGIGCKKGTTAQALRQAWEEFRQECGILPQAVESAATIDLKTQEEGLAQFCREMGWPLRTYSAQELGQARGMFAASEFVRSVTGVDNVCERAAVLSSGGRLLVPKWTRGGVSMAMAIQDYFLPMED